MALPRVDFIKLDLQGMELEALDGAQQTIARCNPIFLLESRKAGREPLRAFLDERGYKVVEAGYNPLAVHKSDPVVQQLQLPDMPAQSAARPRPRFTPSRLSWRRPQAASARSHRRPAPP
jgi:hypothetical protein